MLIAILFSTGQGALLPTMSIFFGDLTNSFSPLTTGDELVDIVLRVSLQMIYVGIAVCFAAIVASFLWLFTASKQAKKLKNTYFNKLITQNCTWYDMSKIETLSNKFSINTHSIQEIFSGKLHLLFYSLGMIFGGIIIGFAKGWIFTLIILAISPIIMVCMGLFIKNILKGSEVSQKVYANAGAISDETFTFIKTIKSLCGEDHQYKKYEEACDQARRGVISFNKWAAFFFGLFFGSIFIAYATSFLLGSRLIYWGVYNDNLKEPYNVGSILTIFFSVITGVFGFSSLGPVLQSIQGARVAMGSVLHIIKTGKGELSGSVKPENMTGRIEFKNVTFAYPSKKNDKVLKNVSFEILPGQKSALVGPSGCGKSTCIQLLLRFYDVDEGEILLDGINI